jgi:ketosteroid isomerase-like protein
VSNDQFARDQAKCKVIAAQTPDLDVIKYDVVFLNCLRESGYEPVPTGEPAAGSNNRAHVPRAVFARALLFSVVILLAVGAKSYAQESDVKAAINAYHAALGSLDMSKMEPLWAHDINVILINPADKSVSVGWDAVKKDWQAQFNFLSELKVTQADGPHVSVKGDVAWATGIANAAAKSKAGADAGGLVYESDVKRDGRWLLVSHVALQVPK